MDNNLMVELGRDEAEAIRGGYDMVLVSYMYRGTFSLRSEPQAATPIQLPQFS